MQPVFVRRISTTVLAFTAFITLSTFFTVRASEVTLLNVSYDVSREFYKDINPAFAAHYKKTSGKDVKVDQSHAGSSAQARAVADGLEADVVTMNTTTDIEFLAGRGLLLLIGRSAFHMAQHLRRLQCSSWFETEIPRTSGTGPI